MLQKRWGAQPPRLPFDAPSHRTLTAAQTPNGALVLSPNQMPTARRAPFLFATILL
jgi:hypothetical protein